VRNFDLRQLERLGLDAVFDASAPEARRRAPARMVLTILLLAVSAPLVRWQGLATWALVVAVGELGLWITTAPRTMRRWRVRARAVRLLASFCTSLGWVVIASVYWATGEESLRLMAIAVLGGIITYVQKSTERTPINMLACFTPPAVAIVGLPLSSRLDAAHLAGLLGALGLLLLFGCYSWLEGYRSWRALQTATDALIGERETARAASRVKSEFLANMSHEIRTPLNGVVGVVDVLARSERDPERLRLLEIVRSSGMTLERILSDVLDVSRLESGAVEIESRPFSLARALEETVALFAARAADKGIGLELAIDPALAAPVLGDSVRLKQILANLVSNAIKFTRAGEVSVRAALVVTPKAGQEAGPQVKIEVRDTGVGFDASDKARIFGRFQQADGSITRRFGGTGLGLSISRQLAELMEGDLDCSSEPGRGAVFILTIPARFDVAGAVETPPEETAAALPVPARPLQVLLADDHPVNRKVVELMLVGAPVELTAVEDGQAALDAFAVQDFDLVLMDMQMPVMDGLTAVACIREAEASGRSERTPIVMLTANALPEHAEAARAAGADAHMTKPLRAAELLALIARLLEVGDGESRAALG
jgi:signal transduction histidine kinase/CheY-like chemotaxis protein